jgi:HrpA-like RNA helicase
VILATNIAETSVTINGVRYIVDTGMVKQRTHNAHSGFETLQVKAASKAQVCVGEVVWRAAFFESAV